MQLLRRIPQVVLGAALAYAGIGHLTTNRTEFQAQVPTIFKSIADFVHGPIAAVDEELPVIIFDAGGVNSEELSDLNGRLIEMGITTYTSSLDPNSSIPLPQGLSEILNSIPIIIRGQQLSYLWALALGRNPDSPVGLTKMTLTY